MPLVVQLPVVGLGVRFVQLKKIVEGNSHTPVTRMEPLTNVPLAGDVIVGILGAVKSIMILLPDQIAQFQRPSQFMGVRVETPSGPVKVTGIE